MASRAIIVEFSKHTTPYFQVLNFNPINTVQGTLRKNRQTVRKETRFLARYMLLLVFKQARIIQGHRTVRKKFAKEKE